ncbi:hypothetical protein ABZZ79_38885 [Streptomyces sp. NPDC006458]|uniref:hypothetical protein n=1 Tax=Streptomyces sp. NPDC006458 TaxID=3154302 RepID=UPI0033BB749A
MGRDTDHLKVVTVDRDDEAGVLIDDARVSALPTVSALSRLADLEHRWTVVG